MRFHKKTINDVPLDDRTVLLRADYNVPLDDNSQVHDDYRIRMSLPTVQALLKRGCKVVIIAHLGRPEGREEKYSLEPVAAKLAELLGEPVRFVDQTVGEKVRMAVKRAPKRSVIILENLRFHAEEEANDEAFAKQLAKDSGARYFVQDGFGVVHRDHASTAAITLQTPSVAGLLLEREYSSITSAMQNPKRPFVAVTGGAKVSDKIEIVERFIDKADTILIGGAMANTFLAYKGVPMDASKYEPGQEKTLDKIYAAAEAKVGQSQVDSFLLLPTDVAVKDKKGRRRDISVDDVDGTLPVLDIGPGTMDTFTRIVSKAATVVWNGTMGYAEETDFSHGSARMALALAAQDEQTSVIGGGDTADFVLHWDSRGGESFTHVSTGGGASLELMSDYKLPGIEHLLDA